MRTILRTIFGMERRMHPEPFPIERREPRKPKMAEAEKMVRDEIRTLNETIKAHTNDTHRQRVVIWSTFQPLCLLGVSVAGVRHCAHTGHRDRGQDAICDESLCPLIAT